MRSLFLVAGMFMVMIFATWAYRVNNDTREAMGRVASLQREMQSKREAIAVLDAEWAYLNRPDRLLALSEEHFTSLQLMRLVLIISPTSQKCLSHHQKTRCWRS